VSELELHPDEGDAQLIADLRALGAQYRQLPPPRIETPWPDRPGLRANSRRPTLLRWWTLFPAAGAVAAALLLAASATVVVRHPAPLASRNDLQELQESALLMELLADNESQEIPRVPTPFAPDAWAADSLHTMSLTPFSSEFRSLGGLWMRISPLEEQEKDDETSDASCAPSHSAGLVACVDHARYRIGRACG
jgi:hypothetical protein